MNSQAVLVLPTHFPIVYNLKKTNGPFPNQTTGPFPTMKFPIPFWTAKFLLEAPALQSSEAKEVHFPHHHMTILEQHWDEEATNINQTKFFRSNITVETKTNYFPSFPSLNQLSHLKIPLISAGGAIVFILLAGIGIKLAISRKTNNPTGDVNVNINTTNSANNDNKASNTANNHNDISEDSIKLAPTAPNVTPPPPFNYPGMNIKEILEKKPSKQSPEEQKLALQHIREEKELEASQQ